MKITVLCGGLSPERDVSLSSGSLIAGALVRRGHEVCLVDLYTGLGMRGEAPAFTTYPIKPYRVPPTFPDLEALKAAAGRGDRRVGPGVRDLCAAADVVFIALHGGDGENGHIQALLDMEGIRYTGSGYIGSLLAMDKDISKQMLRGAGVATPPWLYVTRAEVKADPEALADRLAAAVGYPLVIKPTAGGSSVGVSIPADRTALLDALRAADSEDTLIAERFIQGRELTVSLLGDRTLPAVEIIPHEGFYDYTNKYQDGLTEELCPAPLTDTEAAALAAAARQGFAALRLSGYARFDFILDADGTPWCLEANTLPGMTPTSLLPRAAAAAGITYDELCEHMVHMATGSAAAPSCTEKRML